MMNKFYSLSADKKLQIFSVIREKTGLPSSSIEKDWWIVQTLRLIYQMDAAGHLLFKGGTSLNKAWKLIDRFSEDIDLALNRGFLGFPEKMSRSQISKLRKASLDYLSKPFYEELKKRFRDFGFTDVEIRLGEIKSPDHDPLIIEIYYPAIMEKSQYIEPRILVEIGSRSLSEPFTVKRFSSMVGEHFTGQSFADDLVEIPCVNPERTYLEKLFLLHEEFQRPAKKIRVNRLSRHFYDIYKISHTDFGNIAIRDKMLYKTIVKHRKLFSKMSGVDYHSHFPPNLNPVPPVHLRDQWKIDYKTMQNEMIYGDSPDFETLIKSIEEIVAIINNQEWRI